MRGSAAFAHAAADAAATASWKAGGDLLSGAAGGEVVVYRAHERRSVAEGPRVRLGGRGAGELLELDRRLALVRHLLADAEERGDRVEEAPHPGGERRVHLQALAHERPALERHGAAGRLQVGRRDAPRLADRGLAARKRHRLQVGEALERAEVKA